MLYLSTSSSFNCILTSILHTNIYLYKSRGTERRAYGIFQHNNKTRCISLTCVGRTWIIMGVSLVTRESLCTLLVHPESRSNMVNQSNIRLSVHRRVNNNVSISLYDHKSTPPPFSRIQKLRQRTTRRDGTSWEGWASVLTS